MSKSILYLQTIMNMILIQPTYSMHSTAYANCIDNQDTFPQPNLTTFSMYQIQMPAKTSGQTTAKPIQKTIPSQQTTEHIDFWSIDYWNSITQVKGYETQTAMIKKVTAEQLKSLTNNSKRQRPVVKRIGTQKLRKCGNKPKLSPQQGNKQIDNDLTSLDDPGSNTTVKIQRINSTLLMTNLPDSPDIPISNEQVSIGSPLIAPLDTVKTS